MSVALDARSDNWRFIVPSEPDDLLVLAADIDSIDLDRIRAHGPYGGIAVTDLGAVATALERSAGAVVAALAAALADDGWLLVGYSNRWSPLRAGRGLAHRRVRGLLASAGLRASGSYLPLPDSAHPAMIVPASRRAELDHVLRSLFLNYLPADAGIPAWQRRLLPLVRALATIAPHRLRVAFAPAFYEVAVSAA